MVSIVYPFWWVLSLPLVSRFSGPGVGSQTRTSTDGVIMAPRAPPTTDTRFRESGLTKPRIVGWTPIPGCTGAGEGMGPSDRISGVRTFPSGLSSSLSETPRLIRPGQRRYSRFLFTLVRGRDLHSSRDSLSVFVSTSARCRGPRVTSLVTSLSNLPIRLLTYVQVLK